MKHLLSIALCTGIASALTGCVVRETTYESRSRSTTVVHHDKGGGHRSASRDCGPAHHWNGSSCEHNGKAKGHYK